VVLRFQTSQRQALHVLARRGTQSPSEDERRGGDRSRPDSRRDSSGYVCAAGWATKKGYLARNPLTEDSALKRGKVAQRNRRLQPDVLDKNGTLKEAGEERRLLAAAGPRLQNIIIAALETCCRRGELLSLQWRDVNLDRGELMIRAENAKDGDTRVLPISARLAAVLKMAKTDPAGEDYKPHDYVFGELGKQIDNVKRGRRAS
jgi:integrase